MHMAAPKSRKIRYVALIVDMVGSRELSEAARARAQKRFGALVQQLNKRYSKQIAARFVITLGDEFQGLLRSTTVIPDIISELENDFSDRTLRVGIGLGQLYTQVPKYAINVDGPALHSARSAVEKAKSSAVLGGVFEGFGTLDVILNGVARLLWFHRFKLTEQQRMFFNLLRKGLSQTQIAESLKISRQLVSKQLMSAGWSAYAECEAAWRGLFTDYAEPML